MQAGEALAPLTCDIHGEGAPLAAAVAPANVDELQAVLRLAARHAVAVLPRGGGSSYTRGYLADAPGALLLDLRRLDRILAIDETDAFVTVEAGVTWTTLDAALAERGWRARFRGPFSGTVATVGGALAQQAISHGTGAHGMAGDNVLALDVVLADGSLLRTGSAAVTGHPFLRHAGPDLSGLFIGGCGTLGVIARATLPIQRRPAAWAGLSVAFDRFEAMHAGLRAAALEAVDDTHFALDAAMLRGALQRPRGAADLWRMARRISAGTPGLVAPLVTLARLAWAGDRALQRPAYVAHHLVDGGSAAEVRARMRRLRRALRPHGRELPATVPTVLHHQPYERMFHVLGPHGERWVPLHGLLPHSRVAGFQADFERWRATHTAEGAWLGCLYECIGAGAFSIEICLYWRDALNAYHRAVVPPKLQPDAAPDPALRETISAWRRELIALLQAHGAVQMQIGRTYGHVSRLQPPAADALRAIKQALDPAGRMNPGALEL